MNTRKLLYRADQVRELDRLAIEDHGIPGYELMNRAGAAAFAALRQHWPQARSISVCCGGGNNGGDGYVIARLAAQAGFGVQLIALKAPDSLRGDASTAASDWLTSGGEIGSMKDAFSGELLVDALLGTGLDRAPEGEWAELIERMNDSGVPVLAVDVPSGLNADTGMPLGPTVCAALTVTFIGNKRGLFTGQAGRWCGEVQYADLDTPVQIHTVIAADAYLLEAADLARALPARYPDTHKGDLGHVLIMGGDTGMAGAPVLAGMAALRAGSGLVSLATRAEHAGHVLSLQPELMCHGVESTEALEACIERAHVLALGPGLGQSDWSIAVFRQALQAGKPLVVDADGLNLLARQGDRADSWILTPHPGEAARLLECTVADIQRDRFAAVQALARRYAAVVVLKGHGTLIAAVDGTVEVCPYGNPAMASAGMGDALTGVIASLAGQGLGLCEAARCGVLAHSLAGDAAAAGRRQILASDLIKSLATVLPT